MGVDRQRLHRRLHYLQTELLQGDHYSLKRQEALEVFYIEKGLLSSDWAEEEVEDEEEQYEEVTAPVSSVRHSNMVEATTVEEEFDSDDEERIPMSQQWRAHEVQEKRAWGRLDRQEPPALPLNDTPRVGQPTRRDKKNGLLDLLFDFYMAGLEPDLDYEQIDGQRLEEAEDEKEKGWEQADAYFDTD